MLRVGFLGFSFELGAAPLVFKGAVFLLGCPGFVSVEVALRRHPLYRRDTLCLQALSFYARPAVQ